MTLTAVRTGEQIAVASGSARKMDTRFIGGGLVGPGLGAVAGGFQPTAAALLIAYDRLIPQVSTMIAQPAFAGGAPNRVQPVAGAGQTPRPPKLGGR